MAYRNTEMWHVGGPGADNEEDEDDFEEPESEVGQYVAVVNDDPENYPEYEYYLMEVREVKVLDDDWKDADGVKFRGGDKVVKGRWLEHEGSKMRFYRDTRRRLSGALFANLLDADVQVLGPGEQGEYGITEDTHRRILAKLGRAPVLPQ